MRINHKACDHEATDKARRACRKSQLGEEMSKAEVARLSDFHAAADARRRAIKRDIAQVAADPKAAVDQANRKLVNYWITGDSTIAPDDAQVLSLECTGPNSTCRKLHKSGRSVHVIADSVRIRTLSKENKPRPSLVMPDNHYHTVGKGRMAIAEGWRTGKIISTDEELYAAREARQPYILLPGWIDPTCRRTADWEAYNNARGLNA